MNWYKDRMQLQASLEAMRERLADHDSCPSPLTDRDELLASIAFYERLIGLTDAEIDAIASGDRQAAE